MISIYIVFDFLDKFERTLFYKKYIYIAAYFIYFITLTLTGMISPTVNLIVGIIGVILIGHFLYNNSKVYILYYCIFLLFICCFRIVAMVILKHFTPANQEYFSNVGVIVMLFIFNSMTKMFILFFKKRKIREVTSTQYLTFLFFPLLGLIYILPSLIYINGQTSGFQESLFVINAIFIIILSIYIANTFESISKSNAVKNELNLYEQQAKLQYKYYNDLENKYKNSRKVIHDMKNHLQAIEKLYELQENEAAERYTMDMYEMLDSLGQKYYCRNKVLNIIINDKVRSAELENIKIKCEIDDLYLEFIKDIDLTTIMANLLDNCIEAAKKNMNNSAINLKITRLNGFIVIELSNTGESFLSKTQERNSKFSEENHDIGLMNIEKAVMKYDGDIMMYYYEKEFEVKITIPMKEIGTV